MPCGSFQTRAVVSDRRCVTCRLSFPAVHPGLVGAPGLTYVLRTNVAGGGWSVCVVCRSSCFQEKSGVRSYISASSRASLQGVTSLAAAVVMVVSEASVRLEPGASNLRYAVLMLDLPLASLSLSREVAAAFERRRDDETK